MNAIPAMIENTSVKHNNLMKQLLDPLQRNFGINYFCYQHVTNDGHWFTLGNNPDWLFYSAENQFYLHDPSLVNPLYMQTGLCFPKQHQHSEFQQLLMNEAIGKFNLDHALAVFEKNHHGCDYYFFAGPSDNMQLLNHYINNVDFFKKQYRSFVQQKLRNVLPQCLDNHVNLLEVNTTQFRSTANILQVNNGCATDLNLNGSETVILTKRERECIKLYKNGYTAKESAQLLGISYRTIEEYFNNVKNKFGISQKRDLLRINELDMLGQ